MQYTNAATQELIFKLAMAMSIYEEFTDKCSVSLKPQLKYVKTCHTLSGKMLDGIVNGLDSDAKEYAIGMIKRDVARLKGFHEPDKPTITMPESDFEKLFSDAYSECATCLKTRGEMKNCEKRKILKHIQASGINDVCRCFAEEG